MLKSGIFKFLFLIILGSNALAQEITAPNYTRFEKSPSILLSKKKETDFSNVSDVVRSSGATVFKKVFPSVVKILTNQGAGTGIVVDNDDAGIILTNYHVVHGYSSVGVVFPNDRERDAVTIGNVIKVDQIKDLALVLVNEKRQDLIPLEIDSAQSEIGENVHAIGHPLGEDWTYTRGYVSQIRNNYSWKTGIIDHHVANIIQTQTPINPGNSGGPLVNDAGKLIGVNTFGNTQGQGINYSVAVSSIFDFFASEGDTLRVSMDVEKTSFGNMLGSVDENKNGNPDLYIFDHSNNSIQDTIVVDKDEDLSADIILFDNNENGIVEIKIEFAEIDGQRLAVYSLDDDEDDEFDTIGFDFDLDGKVDIIEPITN